MVEPSGRIQPRDDVLVFLVSIVAYTRMAGKEGLIRNNSIHAGLRTKLVGKSYNDYDRDDTVGFAYIETDGITPGGIC